MKREKDLYLKSFFLHLFNHFNFLVRPSVLHCPQTIKGQNIPLQYVFPALIIKNIHSRQNEYSGMIYKNHLHHFCPVIQTRAQKHKCFAYFTDHDMMQSS